MQAGLAGAEDHVPALQVEQFPEASFENVPGEHVKHLSPFVTEEYIPAVQLTH